MTLWITLVLKFNGRWEERKAQVRFIQSLVETLWFMIWVRKTIWSHSFNPFCSFPFVCTYLFIDFVPLTKPAPNSLHLRLLWISNYILGLIPAKKRSWCHGCPHSLSTWDRDCRIGDIKMSPFTLFWLLCKFFFVEGQFHAGLVLGMIKLLSHWGAM